MEDKKDILKELEAISPLIAHIEKINIFSVPSGYFQNFSEQLIKKIKDNATSQKDIPPGYFDNLAENILSKIKSQQSPGAQEEIQTLSPVLFQLQPTNVFKVPPGYFNAISNEILQKIHTLPTAKIVRLRKYNSFLKYAVAAIFTGVIAFGAFKFTHTNVTVNTNVPQYVVEGEKIQNIDDELAKIDDADILKYLQNNNEEVDATLVINSLDDKGLPTEEDYLTDEQALDNYLDNLNINDSKN